MNDNDIVQALREALLIWTAVTEHVVSECVSCSAAEIADMALAAVTIIERQAAELDKLRKATRWIPVTERLPELPKDLYVDDEYNVIIAGFNVPTTLYYVARDEWRDRDGNFYAVSHWLPLPKPPKEAP
jgi:hypothetical protein